MMMKMRKPAYLKGIIKSTVSTVNMVNMESTIEDIMVDIIEVRKHSE